MKGIKYDNRLATGSWSFPTIFIFRPLSLVETVEASVSMFQVGN